MSFPQVGLLGVDAPRNSQGPETKETGTYSSGV